MLISAGRLLLGGYTDAVSRKGRSVGQYALDARMGQKYSTLIVDFYADILYVDCLISGHGCLAGISPDGTVTVYEDGQKLSADISVRNHILTDIFLMAFSGGQRRKGCQDQSGLRV